MATTLGRTPFGFRRYGPTLDGEWPAQSGPPLPGPIRQALVVPVPMQTRVAQAASKRKVGITVNRKSEITGSDWIKKIKASSYVPRYFIQVPRGKRGVKKQLLWKNSRIQVPYNNFSYPTNQIKKTWLSDWLAAFSNNDWEISTFHLEVKVSKNPVKVAEEVVPQLSNNETIAADLTNEWKKDPGDTMSDFLGKLKFTFGQTFTPTDPSRRIKIGASLNSKRGLIVICTKVRIEWSNGPQKAPSKFTVTDDEIVKTWFHEIAVHAGRESQGLVNTHESGNSTVKSHTVAIKEMFDKKRPTFDKMIKEIKKFL